MKPLFLWQQKEITDAALVRTGRTDAGSGNALLLQTRIEMKSQTNELHKRRFREESKQTNEKKKKSSPDLHTCSPCTLSQDLKEIMQSCTLKI